MGWSYRKSVSVGSFRVNLGKSGVGYSLGGAGFRVGVNARGRKYSSVGIPGTGLRYTTSGKAKPGAGCMVVLCAAATAVLAALVLMHKGAGFSWTYR